MQPYRKLTEQSHQTYRLPAFRYRVFAQLRHLLEFVFQTVFMPQCQQIEGLCGQFHHPQRMLKARVHRTRIH